MIGSDYILEALNIYHTTDVSNIKNLVEFQLSTTFVSEKREKL